MADGKIAALIAAPPQDMGQFDALILADVCLQWSRIAAQQACESGAITGNLKLSLVSHLEAPKLELLVIDGARATPVLGFNFSIVVSFGELGMGRLQLTISVMSGWGGLVADVPNS